MTPIVTVSVLILTVAVPFLAIMIAIYATSAVYRKLDDHGNMTSRADIIDDARCDDPTTRLVSIIRYMYPDMPYTFKFACNGIIVGEDAILTVPECFDEDERVMTANEILDIYFISSGSQYCLNLRTIQKIEKIVELVMMDGETPHRLKVLSVVGVLPACTPFSSSITLTKESSDYSFLGWNDHSVKQHQEYSNETYRGTLSEKPCTNYTGGVVFKGQSVVALLRSNCQRERNRNLPPNERYTLLWDYQEKIVQNFPHAHVRRKEEDASLKYGNITLPISGSEADPLTVQPLNEYHEDKDLEIANQMGRQIIEEPATVNHMEYTTKIPLADMQILTKEDSITSDLPGDNLDESKYSRTKVISSFHGATTDMKSNVKLEEDPLYVEPLTLEDKAHVYKPEKQSREPLSEELDTTGYTANMKEFSVETPKKDATTVEDVFVEPSEAES